MGIRQEAGRRHEQDVDFHLRRGLVGENKIHLFKNLKFEVHGETAQIDHLLLHKYGFIIIESKSVYGEVTVNSSGEWSRSFKGQWYGIASPIAQAENQEAILRQVLGANADRLLGKLLGIRKGFGGRKYDVLIAISSSAIIHRENMPATISQSTVKSEFLGARVKELVSGYGGLLGATTNAWFTDNELTAISEFLAEHQQEPSEAKTAQETDAPVDPKPKVSPKSAPSQPVRPIEEESEAASVEPVTPEQSKPLETTPALVCKHCNNTEGLTEKSGRWGPYVACPKCSKNTPIKEADQGLHPGKMSGDPAASHTQTTNEGEARAAAKSKTASTQERQEAAWEIACKHCQNSEGLIVLVAN